MHNVTAPTAGVEELGLLYESCVPCSSAALFARTVSGPMSGPRSRLLQPLQPLLSAKAEPADNVPISPVLVLVPGQGSVGVMLWPELKPCKSQA